MNRTLLIAIITIITFIAYRTKRKEPIKFENIETIEKTGKIEKALTRFKSFYVALIVFKNRADFIKLGLEKLVNTENGLKKLENLRKI
jgi:hypothetical protein